MNCEQLDKHFKFETYYAHFITGVILDINIRL